MHRTIGYLSKRFVQVRPGEGRKVGLTFLYFFLVITAYYLIKPVSRSLVLGELGSKMVPYVDLVCAALMGPVVTLFARLVDRVSKPALVSGSFWTVIGLLLLFWKLLAWPTPWVAGAFYVWVAIFSVLVVTLFWLVANDLYRPQEAKRLFGFIGSGGILGGVVGSSLAAVGAQVVGTQNLLLLSAGVLIACWFVVRSLWRFSAEPQEAPTPGAARESFLSNFRGFVKLVSQSRYLLLLISMVALNKLVSTLVYYQFNPFIEQMFPNQDARTTFTSMFFGGMNVAAFVIQFFFTSWILRRWGLLAALVVLPACLAGGATGLLLLPAFGVSAVTELCDGSLNYSLQQTTKEVLYLPIDRSIRYKIKPFIDMVVFRFGKGLAAILGIVLLNFLHVPPQALSFVILPLVACWLLIVVWLRRDYVARIRIILQARAASRRPSAPAEPAAAALPPLGSLVDGQPVMRKLALIDRLVGMGGAVSPHATTLIAHLTTYEAFSAGALDLEREVQRLKALIADPGEPMARRRHAVRVLARTADQAVVDYLFGVVMVEQDVALRQEAVRALIGLRLRSGRLEFAIQPIRRQVAYEVANYQRIVHVASIYRQHHRGPLSPDDPVLSMLRVLLEESVEQVFRLLMLLYRPEDIHLVYEQFRAADRYVRADAIELLDNLVDPTMRATIFPILDEERFLDVLTAPASAHEPAAAFRLLQHAIWDHNSWLSVTTLCAVGRLRLTTMRQELERAAQATTPLIASAAKVALDLSARS